jgi:hypothetical protein
MTEWSREEVEAIVADYLQMLALELAGQKFNKTEHRRNLQRKLNGRSEGSVEFKHSNISAVMLALGFPYVTGYQPRSNYQRLLAEVVADQINSRSILDEAALAAVQRPALAVTRSDFSGVRTDPPIRETRATEQSITFTAVKRDYLERETLNRSLGIAGEEFVLLFEHWRLIQMGKPALAERVEHVSRSRGDGLGYDILSFDSDGRERLIEVKTTSFDRETPFFVSRGELALSKAVKDQFHLYRLFQFRRSPRLFDLAGSLEEHCLLDPVTYKASFS